MAINSTLSELDDPILAELSNVDEDNLQSRHEFDEVHFALIFNMIRERYDSSSTTVEEIGQS